MMTTTPLNIEEFLQTFSAKEDELETIVKNSSASSLSRFLYLKKLIAENHPETERVKRETAFFMGNIPWFEYLLSRLEANKGHGFQNNSGQMQDAEESLEGNTESEVAPQPENTQPANPAFSITESTGPEAEEPTENTEDQSKSALLQKQDQTGDEHKVIETDQHKEDVMMGSVETFEPEVETSESTETEAEVFQERKDKEATGIEKNETVGSEPGGETNEPVIPVEPLHTVDYFASQGIKISEADFPEDKLVQQVKSFTGWLKSMKRLHGKLPEQDEAVERIIRNASEASNKESDVATEALAEVLVKQNKKDKAIEMYEKLSLKNPSKSAYFAAKIENLKNI